MKILVVLYWRLVWVCVWGWGGIVLQMFCFNRILLTVLEILKIKRVPKKCLQEINLKIPEPVFKLIVIRVHYTLEAKVWNKELIKQCIKVALGILPFFWTQDYIEQIYQCWQAHYYNLKNNCFIHDISIISFYIFFIY